MTAEQVAALGLPLTVFLRSFHRCFGACRLLDHFARYCRGLRSDLPRKSVKPMVLAAGCTVRAMPLFLRACTKSPIERAATVRERSSQAAGTPKNASLRARLVKAMGFSYRL